MPHHPTRRACRSVGLLSLFALLPLTGCGSSKPAATPIDDAGTDAPPPGPLTLEAGEAAEIPVTDGVAKLRLATPAGTEKYVVVLGSTKLDKTIGTATYSIGLDPIDTTDPAAGTAATKLTGCALDGAAWQTMPAADPAPTGTAPAVGTKKQLVVGTETIDAEVFAVSDTAVVWADVTTGHPANLDKAFVDDFLKDWEAVILPRERSIFGTESDIDHDGHIGLVFSPLTYQSNKAVAFFAFCDLSALTSCAPGNAGEYLYLTPPAAIDPPYNTPAAIKEVLAHETGHMLHFNRKVLRNHLTVDADSMYMAEGIGALAQDVIGYQAGNLYVTQAGLQQLESFSLANVIKDGAQYDSTRDGALRGGAYLFTRWLYDRAGGDLANADGSIANKGGPAFFRALFDSKDSTAASIASVGKADLADASMDFFTTLAMSNRDEKGGAAPKNACFAYRKTVTDPVTGKQRGADLWGTFHGQPMGGPKLQAATKPTGTVRLGGVELLTLDASATGEVDLTVTVDATALPRVRIARVQ
jgi:hypothetical protein